MDSGIYQLTYQTGETYVGKSIHLQTRWRQHFDKLSKGKAAKNMQDAYEASDHHYPQTEVLLYCHPDMLDYYEGYFINHLKPPLNTSIPQELSKHYKDVIITHANNGFAKHSVVTIIEVVNNFYNKIADLEAEKTQQESELAEIESDFEELSAAWGDRARRDAWANREYRVATNERNKFLKLSRDLESEVQELQSWRLRVEQANWWQRLWQSW